ncbi:MAG TPA: alpha/beta fold hydrolase [Candidatus Pristimantibacillus sp.]|nr:alpha/beta fold hydrolase [Candidatus Pristimantibacillus sp.]
MKRVIIVHCWGGTPDYCWYPWAKKELEAKGFQVTVPAMPETDEPKLAAWLPQLAQAIGTPDEETYLVGHSLGCPTIMRYLEQLPDGVRVGGVIFVAGFDNDLGFEELKNFFQTPLNLSQIRPKAARGFYNLHSDNDQYVPVENSKNLQAGLGGEAVILHNMGHFSGPVDNEASCTELPEVITAVEQLSKGGEAI